MNRSIVIAALVGVLAVPATALAGPQPTSTDKRNAQAECRAEAGERGTPQREAFNARYGTNRNKSNAFGKCVSSNTREEHAERHAARTNAAKQCKAEREALGEQAFRAKYGTNENKSNAFGKCVSQRAKANKQAADQKDAEETEARQNAAEQCDAERGETAESRAAFRAKYGTNRNKSNAFGKCVSMHAKAQNDPAPTPTS